MPYGEQRQVLGESVKLPKKRDINDCNNGGRVSNYQVCMPKKILCKMQFANMLREEHSGIRKGRSYIEQIFGSCNIIRQSVEFQNNLS